MAHINTTRLRKALLSSPMEALLMRRLSKLPSDEIEVRVEEFFKFMLLATRITSGSLPISQEVDDLWHIFILETREYERLCCCIGRFVHHTVLWHSVDKGSSLTTDLMFVVGYVSNFGEFRDRTARLWSATGRLLEHLNMDLSALNIMCRELTKQATPLRVQPPYDH